MTGKAPRSVLVVVTRRIGDVLLATPLIRSLKAAWPDTAVDALVFEGTQEVLAANSDVRRVHTIAQRPGVLEHLGLVTRLARRYDVALSLVPSDRPTVYAAIAGRWRAGLLLPTPKERWKRPLLHRWVPFDAHNTHTVLMHLALANAVGVPPRPEVVVSWSTDDERRVDGLLAGNGSAPRAVLHPYPKFNYKLWHAGGWVEVARWLTGRGYRVVLSGGPDAAEIEYVRDLAHNMSPAPLDFAGRLTLGETGYLISGAAVYVGPDTAVTHIAAALGVPTVALYGPTDPVKWGPWPRGYAGDGNPWRRLGSQSVGPVRLIQGEGLCVPCLHEGCDRHTESTSDCLQQMPAARVIAAIESLLGSN